jgi:hypothetical protein
MRFLILIVLLLPLTNCSKDSSKPRNDTVAGLTVTLPSKTAEQTKIESLQQQLVDAGKTAAAAAAAGKTTDRLVAENLELQLRTQIAEQQQIQLSQYLASLRTEKAASDKAVEASRVSDWQWRLYYAAMILGACGLIALVVRFAWPILATPASWAMSIFGGLAVGVTIIGKLLPQIVWFIDFLPYLLWPCGVVLVAYGFAVFRQWWLSHHSTNQLVQAVGGLVSKGLVSATAMEQHLANELDTPFLAHVQQVGQQIAATTQKATLTVKQDVAAVRADLAAVSAPGTPQLPFPATKPPAPPAAGTPT